MIKVMCDKCGGNCDRVGYDIRIGAIHNPTPLYASDTGNARITDDNTQIRFVLCQECYIKMGLPNIYETAASGNIEFRAEKAATVCAGGCLRGFAVPDPHCAGCRFSKESEAVK